MMNFWDFKVGNVLVLGLADSNWTKQATIQSVRDGLRVKALTKMKFVVKTVDAGHSDLHLKNHCQANICDARRLKMSMDAKWGNGNNYCLDHILLDYFISPVSYNLWCVLLPSRYVKFIYQNDWANDWSKGFYRDTLPMFAQEKMLCIGGKIWLPHVSSVQRQLTEFRELLEQFYEVYYMEEYCMHLNPLYCATELVKGVLGDLSEGRTNATQIRPYLAYSEHPFLVLVIKPAYAATVVMIDVEEY